MSVTHKLDSRIKELRRLARKANDVDKCYEHLEELNKLQRERFAETGRFLPHSDGKVYTYEIIEDQWLRW